MRRALLAGALLGVVAGLLFVHHDALELSVVWPVVLGFALWETVGHRGSRGILAAVAAAIGVVLSYAAFGVVSEWLPVTDFSLGIAHGVAVGVAVLLGVWLGDRLPVGALLIGYASFAGLFFPLWEESPANFRSHGLEQLSVAAFSLLLGILTAATVRAVGDGMKDRVPGRRKDEEAEQMASVSDLTTSGGGAS